LIFSFFETLIRQPYSLTLGKYSFNKAHCPNVDIENGENTIIASACAIIATAINYIIKLIKKGNTFFQKNRSLKDFANLQIPRIFVIQFVNLC